MPLASQSSESVAMTCKTKGVLKSGNRGAAGASKKRVHFFDDPKPGNTEPQAATSGESERGRTETEETQCQFAGETPSLDEVLAEVAITCDGRSAEGIASSMRQGEANACQPLAAKHSSSAADFNKAVQFDYIFCAENEDPCTPPCARYGLAGPVGTPHAQLTHFKGVQRTLSFVAGSSEQRQFKRTGSTNKRSLSRSQNYKVVPEGEDGVLVSMDFLAHRDFNRQMQMHPSGLLSEDASRKRCAWITSRSDPVYVAYHDEEWGVPVHDDRRLFELLVFAGAQAEISWSALLAKREAYRNIFAQFDPTILATFDTTTIACLRSNNDIMRSEARVQSIINNAKLVLKIVDEHGSLDAYLWGFVGGRPIVSRHKQGRLIPVRTAKSEAISKDLQRRGFRHAGPIAVYCLMQAAGLANDHLLSCFRHPSASAAASPSPGASALPRKPAAAPPAHESLLNSPRCCATYS